MRGVAFSLAVCLGAGSAAAADLPIYEAPPAAALISPQPASEWGGFYAGLLIGYGWGEAESRSARGAGSHDLTGMTGGFLFGYNADLAGLVVGLEGDAGIHEIKGSGFAGPAITSDYVWSGHLRGRVGVPVGRFLPFVAGGYAVGQLHQHGRIDNSDGAVRTHHGWTLGAGVDVALTQTIAARLEYLYESFGRERYALKATGDVVATTLNAHIVRAAAIVKTGGTGIGLAGAETFDWNGFYAGLHAGYGFGDIRARQAGAGATTFDIDGGLFGGHLGYNLMFGQAVIGVEADLVGSAWTGRSAGAAIAPTATRLFWTASARARAGYAMGRFLPFLTGGYTLAQMDVSNPVTGYTDLAPMKLGWTVGAGLYVALTNAISTRLEYGYRDHRNGAQAGTGGATLRIQPREHLVRAGVSVHFR